MEHNVTLFFNAIEEEILKYAKRFNKRKVMNFTYTKNGFNVPNYFLIDCVTKLNIGCNSGYQMRGYIEKAVKELKVKYNQPKMHLVYTKKDSGNVGYPIRLSLKDWKREKLAENETLYIVEKYDNCQKQVALDAVAKYPNYELRLQSGFGWKGARVRYNKTLDDLHKELNWAVVIDVEIDHFNKVVFVNGFSANDMW